MQTGTAVCPGDVLFSEATHAAGPGTYVDAGRVVACLLGRVRVDPSPLDGDDGDGRPTVCVQRPGATVVAPKPGDVVTCRVLRINPRLASVDIVCVGDVPLVQPLSGVIRAQDVRSTAVDSVHIPSSFLPGDVVRARVSSLGDARAYHLTTAADDLGVVHARGVTSGLPLEPVSWCEMRCPATRAIEKRKVARVAAA